MADKATTQRSHCTFWVYISGSAARHDAFFLYKVASPFLWTRDDLRHLRAGKCLNRRPGRAGWNCDANRFLSNASATHHPRRGVLGVWPPAAGMCPARWQARHRKLPKFSGAHTMKPLFFMRPSTRVCNEVLLGSARGPALGTSLCGRLAWPQSCFAQCKRHWH